MVVVNGNRRQVVNMLIALDYDGTYTADPYLWDIFVEAATIKGHTIYCVTMRTEEEAKEIPKVLLDKVLLICTNRMAKEPILISQGINIDIWIDDNPNWIYTDSF